MSYSNGLSSLKCVNPTTSCCDLSGWALLEYILFCHVMWWIFYYVLLVATRQSEEWCCRFLTLFHGCLISYSALRDAYINKSPIDFQSAPLSEVKKNYLSYMVSYFLFDFCWIHFFGNESWIIYFHHIASILIITNILVKNYGGAGVAYGAAGLEFTNPYLQLRWFLRTHGYYNTPIHKVVELWFMILFFIIRMLGGTILVYYAVMHSDTDVGMKLSFLSIYGISLVLQWQIFVYFRKKYLIDGTRALAYSIQSRVSISPYFQRRTLDRYENPDASEESSAQPPSKMIESPAAGSPLTGSSKIASFAESLTVKSPKVVSPRSESLQEKFESLGGSLNADSGSENKQLQDE